MKNAFYYKISLLCLDIHTYYNIFKAFNTKFQRCITTQAYLYMELGMCAQPYLLRIYQNITLIGKKNTYILWSVTSLKFNLNCL